MSLPDRDPHLVSQQVPVKTTDDLPLGCYQISAEVLPELEPVLWAQASVQQVFS